MKIRAREPGADNVVVFLDGVLQQGAVMADDKKGIVETWRKDWSGAFFVDQPTVILHGKVEIIPGTLLDYGVTMLNAVKGLP